MIFEIVKHVWFFRIFRWSLIAIIFIFWKRLVNYFGIKKEMSMDEINHWQSKRLPIVIALIIFELIVSENIIIKILNLIF